MKLIIYCHPYEKSFNHALLENLLVNNDIEVIDLHKDNFNPVYSISELSLYSQGRTNDPLVYKYQELLKKADHLIIISPIWWNDIPAMLKGFLDKVLKVNFAYTNTKLGVSGKLSNIKKVDIITTSNSPTMYIKLRAGNSINSVLKTTFKQIGIKKVKWFNLGNIKNVSNKKRKQYIKKVSTVIMK